MSHANVNRSTAASETAQPSHPSAALSAPAHSSTSKSLPLKKQKTNQQTNKPPTKQQQQTKHKNLPPPPKKQTNEHLVPFNSLFNSPMTRNIRKSICSSFLLGKASKVFRPMLMCFPPEHTKTRIPFLFFAETVPKQPSPGAGAAGAALGKELVTGRWGGDLPHSFTSQGALVFPGIYILN